jgi:hypothetical protein
MSWYIQTLLKSSVEIRSKSDIESDEFNDLIVVEDMVSKLYQSNLISDEELRLLDYIKDGKPLVDSKRDFGKNRISVSKDINNLCDKIAFYLGGYFTNDGYIDYIKEKYNLTDKQVDNMIDYMSSKYKNKLIRKSRKINE